MGIVEIEDIIQKHSMNEDLRNSLWNMIYTYFFHKSNYRFDFEHDEILRFFYTSMHIDYLKKPVDEVEVYLFVEFNKFKSIFFSVEWFEVYELIEFILDFSKSRNVLNFKLIPEVNSVLKKESSAYRLVDTLFTEITSESEIKEIELALNKSEKYSSVKAHLSQALALMSNRDSPDYRNSGKESISAIESLVKVVTGRNDGTLGKLIIELEKSKIIPASLKSVYATLYGYTSQEDGIRHALTESSKFEYAEARYMLIICSAFVNYVIETYELQSLQQTSF